MSLGVKSVPHFAVIYFLLLISRHVLDKSTASRNFDHFNSKLNTTECPDKTVCPGPQNQSCCNAKKGKKEINFGNNAIIPTAMKDLISYYNAAGYTIPSRTAESSISESTAQRTPSSGITIDSSSTAFSTSTSVSPPSSISSSERNQASGGSGLSISAKVIVGAAVGIAVLLLLFSCFLIHRHRLKCRAVNLVRSAEVEGTEEGRELEMHRNLCELQGSQTAVEIDETNPK